MARLARRREVELLDDPEDLVDADLASIVDLEAHRGRKPQCVIAKTTASKRGLYASSKEQVMKTLIE
jgi:hypothetical protein